MGAKKRFELSRDGLLAMSVKGGLEFSADRNTAWQGRVAVTQKVFNFTEDQDIKFKVGFDLPRQRAFGQVQENNWTLLIEREKFKSTKWSLKYDL